MLEGGAPPVPGRGHAAPGGGTHAGWQRDVVQHWISLRQRQCHWPLLEPLAGHRPRRAAAPHRAARHGLPRRRPDAAAGRRRTRMSREDHGAPDRFRTTADFADRIGAGAGPAAAHRLPLLGPARPRDRLPDGRACSRLHDRTRGRGLRLLLRHPAGGRDQGAHPRLRGALARHRRARRRRGAGADAGRRHRHPGGRERPHPRRADTAAGAPAGAGHRQLARLPGQHGQPLPPLHHRRPGHHPARRRSASIPNASLRLPCYQPNDRAAPDRRRPRADPRRSRACRRTRPSSAASTARRRSRPSSSRAGWRSCAACPAACSGC